MNLAESLTYFTIDHTDDSRAQAHTGNEADVPMILREHRAHASHGEQRSDIEISVPYEWILRANESYQETAIIEEGHANKMADVLFDILHRRRLCAGACR